MMQEFVDQINKSARSATEDMHTALPGEIKSYDPDKGVATVLPKAKFTKPDGSMMDFPEISGVPVMFPQSKNVTIAWPIKKGDGCLLVFKRWPFALRKATFQHVKDHVLERKRRPFATH